MTDFTDLWPAYDVALIAHGLLGPVDELWTQHIDGTGVTVLFSQRKYQDEFLARWQSLIEADWYLDGLHSTPDETSETSGSNYAFSGLLTFDELYAEVGRLKAALTAGGILGADRFDLTTLSVQSKMVQFDLLAASLDLDGHRAPGERLAPDPRSTLIGVTTSYASKAASAGLKTR